MARGRKEKSQGSGRGRKFEIGMKSKPFADLLLQDHGVAGLSGTAFGAHGEGYLRLSYANSEDNIQKALVRIAAAAQQSMSN